MHYFITIVNADGIYICYALRLEKNSHKLCVGAQLTPMIRKLRFWVHPFITVFFVVGEQKQTFTDNVFL